MKKELSKKKTWKISNLAKRKKLDEKKQKGIKKRVRVGKERKEKRRDVPAILLTKEKEPIIAPRLENGWEAWQTFNPGVILLEDKVHFLYRAIGEDGISRLGYALSEDGFTINERLPSPVYEHHLENEKIFSFSFYSYASGGSFGGAEDPRLTRVESEEKIYMTYIACDQGLRVALTSIKVEDFLGKRWRWSSPKLISPPGEIHKNWVLFPEKINNKYALLTSLQPEIQISYFDNLEFKENFYIKSFYNSFRRESCWDTYVRGVGPPPLKTRYGWLIFYHAMDERDWGKYKVGAMILDLKDPTKILHRSSHPILEPDAIYENNGFKAGVVYASGAIVKDGNLLVYYGAADSFVSVAQAKLDEFLDDLIAPTKPRLKRKIVKQKP